MIQVKTSLFAVGLFVLSETDISDEVKHLSTVDPSTINPVLFQPRVNHHLVTYADMKEVFKTAGYHGNGIKLNVRSIELLLFQLATKKKGPKDYSMASMYNVRYETRLINATTQHVDMVQHSSKVASPIPLDYQEDHQELIPSTTPVEFVQKLTSIIKGRKLNNVADLQQLSVDLKLGSLNNDSNFFAAYSELRTLFQRKYKLAVGIVEGSHRLNMAIRVACGGAITNSYHLNKKELEDRNKLKANLSESSCNDMFDVNIHLGIETLPSLLNCQEVSKEILANQKQGFSHSLGNVLTTCLEEYRRRIAIAAEEDENIHRDINIDMYNQAYNEMNEKDFNGENELTTLINNVNKSILLIDNPMNRRWLVVLPHLYKQILLTDKCKHMHDTFVERNGLSSSEKYFERELYLGCTSKAPMVSKSEVAKNNPRAKSIKVPIIIKIVIEFLRCLLFQSSGRTALINYIEKMPISSNVWKQKQDKNPFGGDLHSLPVIQGLLHLALIKTDLYMSILGQGAPNNRLRKQPLKFVLLQTFMKHSIRMLLYVNEDPLVNREYLKKKLGPVVFDQYFSPNKDSSFVVQAMKLYAIYLEKYGNFYKKFQYTFLGKATKNSLHKQRFRQLELKEEELMFKDIKIKESTMDLGKDYIRVPANTLVPGNFVQFCNAIANPEKTKYENFFFDPNCYDVDIESVVEDTEEKNTALDDFSNLEEKLINHFSDMLKETSSQGPNQDMPFSQHFSEAANVLSSHCGNDHVSLQHFFGHLRDKIKEHDNNEPIKFDPRALFDEAKSDGDNDEDDSLE